MDKSRALNLINKALPAEVTKIEIFELLGHGGYGNVYRSEIKYKDGAVRSAALKLFRNNELRETNYFLGIGELTQETNVFAKILNASKFSEWNTYLVENLFCISPIKNGTCQIEDFFTFNALADFSLMDFIEHNDTKYRQIFGSSVTSSKKNECMEQMYKIFTENPTKLFDFIKNCYKGLAVIHSAGFVHRDIKPANILVVRDGNGNFIPKIADFGMSRQVDKFQLQHKPHSFMREDFSKAGTIPFYSPEILVGVLTSTPAIDIYPMAITIYSVLASISIKRSRQNGINNNCISSLFNDNILLARTSHQTKFLKELQRTGDTEIRMILTESTVGDYLQLATLFNKYVPNRILQENIVLGLIPDSIITAPEFNFKAFMHVRDYLINNYLNHRLTPDLSIDQTLDKIIPFQNFKPQFNKLKEFLKLNLALDPLKRLVSIIDYSNIEKITEGASRCVKFLNENI